MAINFFAEDPLISINWMESENQRMEEIANFVKGRIMQVIVTQKRELVWIHTLQFKRRSSPAHEQPTENNWAFLEN